MSDYAHDAARYVEDALGLLPDDPARSSAEDLRTLAAIGEGLQRHIDPVLQQTRALALRVLAGDFTAADIDEFAWLCTLGRRCELAHHRLTVYTAGAVEAHGLTLDRLGAGDH
jgi:hypothetical protein